MFDSNQPANVSIIIVTYNHIEYIDKCIQSIRDLYDQVEILVIDNFSSDNTAQHVKENFNSVKAIITEKNLGYGAGNNLGAKHAKGEFIVFLNPDTIVEQGWLEGLIEPLKERGRLITTPKILIFDGSAINTCGIINHFTGLAFPRGFMEMPDLFSTREFIGAFSGCCFAIRKDDFIELGGFDENFFLYNEDTDLSWRAILKGYDIMFVPTSLVRHDYKLSVSSRKLYFLEMGRYLILRKYLSRRDIVILIPSLLVAEVLTFGYSIKLGASGLKYKFKALHEGLTIKNQKVEGDRNRLFMGLSEDIPVNQLTSNCIEKQAKILANKLFYWNIKMLR